MPALTSAASSATTADGGLFGKRGPDEQGGRDRLGHALEGGGVHGLEGGVGPVGDEEGDHLRHQDRAGRSRVAQPPRDHDRGAVDVVVAVLHDLADVDADTQPPDDVPADPAGQFHGLLHADGGEAPVLAQSNTAMSPSPRVFTTWPWWAWTCSRRIRRWSRMAPVAWRSPRSKTVPVDPSMSVKMMVVVPLMVVRSRSAG